MDVSKWREKFNHSTLHESLSQLEDMLGEHQGDMFGRDLSDVVLTMALLPDHLMAAAALETGAQRWSTIREMVQRSAAIFDTIVGMEYSWLDIEQPKRPEVGSSLLSTVDGMGLVLADAMMDGVQEDSIFNSRLAIQVVRPSPGAPLLLPSWGPLPPDDVVPGLQGDILLEGGYDSDLDPTAGNLSVVFVLYSDLTPVLDWDSDDNQSLPRLNSAVASAVVAQNRMPVRVSSPVRIRMEHIRRNPNGTECVFWNLDSHEWDPSGCRLESSNSTFSVCACDHLTNFAVLMDYRGSLDQVDQLPFFYITVVGCSVSIVCLAICVAIFSCYSYHSKHSWGLRYLIHRNLCLCLLVANFVLVVGLDKTDNSEVCAVVAGLLHYFFLSAFSWMLLEGVHIYLLLVVVFAARRSHWEKFYLFGYGFPLVVVAITAVVRPTYYGTDEVCWLSVEKGTIWAFMGPVAFILIVNTAALLLAQWKASKVSAKDDNIALVKRWLRVTLILFPVLGITWVFGFLYVGEHFEVVGYLFAILNSLQGFCIFVCHCLMDKKARNMVLASLKKKTASVTTGSSGTAQKKPKHAANGAKIEHESANNDAKADEVTIVDGRSKKWTKWRKPWTFFFEMPVTPNSAQNENQEEPPKPIVARWNILKDRAV